MANGGPALRHHLTDLEAVGSIGPETRVRRRTEVEWRVSFNRGGDGGMVTLGFCGRTMRFPAHLAGAVRFVAETDELTSASIPGEVGEPDRLALVQTLIREGFLTLS
jgi:hypothetical protein